MANKQRNYADLTLDELEAEALRITGAMDASRAKYKAEYAELKPYLEAARAADEQARREGGDPSLKQGIGG